MYILQLEAELLASTQKITNDQKKIIALKSELLLISQELNDLSYTERIINTLRDPLIVMDKDLRVMRCTNSFYENFKVLEAETEGRYFFELGNRQWDIPELRYLL